MNTNKMAHRIASRFLGASRDKRSHWLVVGESQSVNYFEVKGKTFKGLFTKIADAIHEQHSYSEVGAYEFRFKKGRVNSNGEIDMQYSYYDGRRKTWNELITLTLLSEYGNKTSELAKPKDINDFKKFLEGQFFGDTPYFYGDKVRFT